MSTFITLPQKFTGIRTFSLEYTDEDGEKIIKHVFCTKEEAVKLIEKFAENNIDAIIYDLGVL